MENTELLMFIDDTLGLEIVEGAITISPVAAGRRVASASEGIRFASAIGSPGHGVILQSTNNDFTIAYKTSLNSRSSRTPLRSS